MAAARALQAIGSEHLIMEETDNGIGVKKLQRRRRYNGRQLLGGSFMARRPP